MKLLLALAAGIAGYCYYRGTQTRRHAKPREELNRWEGEGGNVPSVETPAPVTAAYVPAGDPGLRH
jgi:hypothetical protein